MTRPSHPKSASSNQPGNMMDGPIGSAILRLFEQGVAAGPSERAALLCEASNDDVTASVLPLGDVDRCIWALQRRLFGDPIEATSTCIECGAELEFELPAGFDLPPRRGSDSVEIDHGGVVYVVRMPRLGDMDTGRLDVRVLCTEAPWDDATFVTAVETKLEAADPGLRVSIALACHACASTQTQALDIAGFLWKSIEQAARRLVHDTARIAAVFGWSEAEILGMTARRRALYLEEIAR